MEGKIAAIALSSVGRNRYIHSEAFHSLQPFCPVSPVRRGRNVTIHLLPGQMNSLQDRTYSVKPLSRRDALAKLAAGSVVVAAVTGLLVFLRVPIPFSLRERTLIRVGHPDRFPFNTFTFVPERNLFIYRSRGGFKALSALCPHLGCVVTSTGSGFRCPCHGSTFDNHGTVLGGPAPKALSWLKVGLAPDGQITVDASERVSGEQLLKA
jgi:cytochrome b6-f complex iron-sulfur subunit